jgi:hypothetical protein
MIKVFGARWGAIWRATEALSVDLTQNKTKSAVCKLNKSLLASMWTISVADAEAKSNFRPSRFVAST